MNCHSEHRICWGQVETGMNKRRRVTRTASVEWLRYIYQLSSRAERRQDTEHNQSARRGERDPDHASD